MLLRMGRLMEEYLFISSFERANKKKREKRKERGGKRKQKKETKQRTFDSLTIQWIPKWKRNRECRKKRKRERERKKIAFSCHFRPCGQHTINYSVEMKKKSWEKVRIDDRSIEIELIFNRIRIVERFLPCFDCIYIIPNTNWDI